LDRGAAATVTTFLDFVILCIKRLRGVEEDAVGKPVRRIARKVLF
jgi:hypothetical protein